MSELQKQIVSNIKELMTTVFLAQPLVLPECAKQTKTAVSASKKSLFRMGWQWMIFDRLGEGGLSYTQLCHY